MKWATRAHIHVDRAACAWLIRRFIDPTAEFLFVTDPADVPADTTGFDMRGVALGHHNGRCTFETALLRFDLTADPAWKRSATSSTKRTWPTKPTTHPSPPAWTY